MKKIGIIGHFGFGLECLDGQTIKTKIIADELKRHFGEGEVKCIDTHGGLKFMCRLPGVLLNTLISCRDILIMPAHKGIQIIAPILWGLNLFFRRRLTYIVVGGWLPEKTNRKPLLRWILQRFYGVYVETPSMKQKLVEQGFGNVFVMPNCKRLKTLDNGNLPVFESPSSREQVLPLCMFSRVMPQKGVEDAIQAVQKANERLGCRAFCLDIFGQVWKGEEDWFEKMMEPFGGVSIRRDRVTSKETLRISDMSSNRWEVRYGGLIPYDKSVETLSQYFALLFPTFYFGECFAGTLLDALAAGLPVIASDWHDNSQIVHDGETGILFPVHDVERLTDILVHAAQDPTILNSMRLKCLEEAQKYVPEEVIRIYTDSLEE